MLNQTQGVAGTARAREPYRRIESPAELAEILRNPHAWVSDIAASQILGIPRGTLRRFRAEGRGPRYRKVGGAIRYQVAWLIEFVSQTTVETSETRPIPASEGIAMHG
jgi:hypothetical protein